MARAINDDHLQNNKFWLIDVEPSRVFPFFVLGGIFLGFSAITFPELNAETKEIRQINSQWCEREYTQVTVGEITLSRGVQVGDSSMYRWWKRSVNGRDISRRNMVLIQYTRPMSSQSLGSSNVIGAALGGLIEIGGGSVPPGLVPGRMWMLWGCVPMAYTPGQGLDASNADVSIAELRMQPWALTEMEMPI